MYLISGCSLRCIDSSTETKGPTLQVHFMSGWIAPVSNMSLRCSRTSSTWGGGIHWKHSLKGNISGSWRTILCLAAPVWPNLCFSREKNVVVFPEETLCLIGLLRHPTIQTRQVQLLQELSLSFLFREGLFVSRPFFRDNASYWGYLISSFHSSNGDAFGYFKPVSCGIYHEYGDSSAPRRQGTVGVLDFYP